MKRIKSRLSNERENFLQEQSSFLPLDVLALIFIRLDIPSLRNTAQVCKDWCDVLRDNHVWKRIALISFPSLEILDKSLDFPLTIYDEHTNRKIQMKSWKDLCLARQHRFNTEVGQLEKRLEEFKASRSLMSLENLRALFSDITLKSEVIGYFVKLVQQSAELQFLADGILFAHVKIQSKNLPGYKYREDHEYSVQGMLMALDGTMHQFSFIHEYAIMGQEVELRTPPTVSIGPHSLDIIRWETEIENFISKTKALLKLNKVPDRELWKFIEEHMIPERTKKKLADSFFYIERSFSKINYKNQFSWLSLFFNNRLWFSAVF